MTVLFRQFRWVLIVVLIVLTHFPVHAQRVDARAVLERDTILIGDQIQFVLELTQDRDLHVWFPEYADTLIGNIEILERTSRDTAYLEDDLLAIRQSFLLTSFDSGFYRIPGQIFRVESNRVEGKVRTNPLTLRVLTMEIDTTKAIYDIKLPYDAPLGFSDFWPYLVFALLGGGILFLVWKWIRDRQRKRSGLVKPKALEPAHVVALRELDRLKEEKLWQNNQYKPYYTRLSQILREYLENRYFIRAMEETTWEILRDLKKSGFNDNRLFDKLNDILTMSDLVKFARWRPLPEENETALLDAYIFINETKQVAPHPDADEDAPGSENSVSVPDDIKDIETKSDRNG